MAATSYLVTETKHKQGNIQITHESSVRTVVELYGNEIISHWRQESRDGDVIESMVLDTCDRPTLTTARAMNRGLKQFGFSGEIEFHNNGILTYRNQQGIGVPLVNPIMIHKDGTSVTWGGCCE